MAATSLQEKAKMQGAQTVALEQLQKAEAWAKIAEAAFFVTDAQRASLKAIRDTRALFTTWSTTWRAWAEKGQTPTGEAYGVPFWLRIGGDFVSALKTYSGGLYDGSVFAIAANTAAASVKDLGALPGKAFDSLTQPWSLKTKLALAGAGVVVLAIIAAGVSKSLPVKLARQAVAAAT